MENINENIDNEPMYVSDAFVNEGKNTFNLQARKRYLAKLQTNLNIKPLKKKKKNYQDLKTELIKGPYLIHNKNSTHQFDQIEMSEVIAIIKREIIKRRGK